VIELRALARRLEDDGRAATRARHTLRAGPRPGSASGPVDPGEGRASVDQPHRSSRLSAGVRGQARAEILVQVRLIDSANNDGGRAAGGAGSARFSQPADCAAARERRNRAGLSRKSTPVNRASMHSMSMLRCP